VYPASPVSTPSSETPLISVVTPTHGRPQWLAEAIQSVLAQTVQEFELIVVDDASPEPVAIPEHPRVRLIRRDENGGAAAARNTGVDAARGKYLMFLDDDDAYTPSRLELGLRGMERGPVGVCRIWTLGVPIGGDDKLDAHLRHNENRRLDGRVGDVILNGLPPHLGQLTIARDAFLPFEPRFKTAEDIEWWLRAAQTLPVVTVPEVGYLKRRHATSRLNYQHQVRMDSNLLLLREHADWFAAHPKAAARRWRSQAIFAGRKGDRRAARDALARSFRLDPRASTLTALARTFAPALRRTPAQP
jgi:glycosyltransferase involved in cell wall biosynthesis